MTKTGDELLALIHILSSKINTACLERMSVHIQIPLAMKPNVPVQKTYSLDSLMLHCRRAQAP